MSLLLVTDIRGGVLEVCKRSSEREKTSKKSMRNAGEEISGWSGLERFISRSEIETS